MDGLDGHAAHPRTEDVEPRERIADEFARIMGHSDGGPRSNARSGIDVATYLLNPPKSAATLERRARRQRWVGIGSLAACLLLGVLLIAPWPGASPSASGTADPIAAADRTEAPEAEPAAAPSEATRKAALPKRLDVPGQRVRARRVDPVPAKRRQRGSSDVRRRVASAPRAPVRVTRPASVPAPVRPPQPSPPAEPAPAMLVPLS